MLGALCGNCFLPLRLWSSFSDFQSALQLRFLLGPRREVAGRISEVEPFLEQDDNGSRWVTRCTAEFEVEGRLYQRSITRRMQPALGETVMLTYPVRRPDEAVEGDQQAAAKRQIFAIAAKSILRYCSLSCPAIKRPPVRNQLR